MLSGDKSFLSYLIDYVAPVLLGNIAGGSALVAMLNHAQVRHEGPAAQSQEPAGEAAGGGVGR